MVERPDLLLVLKKICYIHMQTVTDQGIVDYPLPKYITHTLPALTQRKYLNDARFFSLNVS